MKRFLLSLFKTMYKNAKNSKTKTKIVKGLKSPGSFSIPQKLP
jgi:hypothetical protein